MVFQEEVRNMYKNEKYHNKQINTTTKQNHEKIKREIIERLDIKDEKELEQINRIFDEYITVLIDGVL